jgi:hypothetical protein
LQTRALFTSGSFRRIPFGMATDGQEIFFCSDGRDDRVGGFDLYSARILLGN